jgi:hypothetical protein
MKEMPGRGDSVACANQYFSATGKHQHLLKIKMDRPAD